jgi:hypothetical protein
MAFAEDKLPVCIAGGCGKEIKRKNPQGLVRGFSREIEFFAFFGQKIESWFFWIFGIPVTSLVLDRSKVSYS